MKDKKIIDAYDRMLPDDERRDRNLEHIITRLKTQGFDGTSLNSENDRTAHNVVQTGHSRRRSSGKWRLAGSIAAVLAVVVAFGGVAYANGWFGLGLREYAPEPETTSYYKTTVNREGETVVVAEVEQVHRSMSLVGAIGSPEYRGQKEWVRWYEEYHRTAKSKGINFPCTLIPGDYEDKVYGAFNDEMKAKLAEICEKYGLRLHPDEQYTRSYEELCDELGYAPLRELQTDDDLFEAVYYTDGAFYLTELPRLNGLHVGLHFSLKGVLDDVWGGLYSDPSEYEERIVSTDDGIQILVAENKSDEKGETILVIPLDKGQITVRAYNKTANYEPGREKMSRKGLTESELQELIANINISSMGSQTEDVLEDNMKYAENYVPDAYEDGSAADNGMIKLDTTLQEATPEIKELIGKYYLGRQNGDPDMIRQTSMYPEAVEDEGILRVAEDYEEIRVQNVYMVPAANDGEWMVFVRYEVKYKEMDPVVPYISSFYVFTDEDGSLKQLYLSWAMQKYFMEDQQVSEIIKMLLDVNQIYPEVVEMRNECAQALEKACDEDPVFDEYIASVRPMGSSRVGSGLKGDE